MNTNVVEGSGKQKFVLHRNFICHYSPFFDATFNGDFKEGKDQQLDLEETDPKVFGIFVNWLYTQEIVAPDEYPATSSHLVRLWVLADRMLVPKLQDDALEEFDKLRVEHRLRLSGGTIQYIYDNTVDGSPLRRYVVALEATGYKDMPEDFVDLPQFFPREMLVDMIKYLTKRPATPWVKFAKKELRDYHVIQNDMVPSTIRPSPSQNSASEL